MFARLETDTHLRPNARILEIGPGTGQATRDLLDRGTAVTAVELGSKLAQRLETELGDRRLTVINDTFEKVPLKPESFDLATCATAFHWIDPRVAVPKIAEALTPNGALAVWWNVYQDPERHHEFHADVGRLLRAFDAATPRTGTGSLPFALQTDDRIADLSTGGHFTNINATTYRWVLKLNADTVRGLFNTFSHVSTMASPQRERFLDKLGEMVENNYQGHLALPSITRLYIAQR